MDAPEYECFTKGARVEVCFDEMGFRGSWYTATIIETPSKRAQKVFLQFDNLLDEDDGDSKDDGKCPPKPLRDHVNYILVRPLITGEPERTYQLSDDVDAFHNEGWWEGVVTGVYPASSDGRPARYSVFFRSSREQIEFYASQLRLHREWVYGKWVPPLEEVENADGDAAAPAPPPPAPVESLPPLSSPGASSTTEMK